MIVTLEADGAVVRDADDCDRLCLSTALDADALRVALRDTGIGEPGPDGDVWLHLALLRSRALIVATEPDWAVRWSALVDDARRAGRVSADGRSMRVPVEA